jgi:hypothetical protein
VRHRRLARLYVDTRLTYPLGTIQTIAATNIDPRPLERVPDTCFTQGVTFEHGMPPRIYGL